MVEWGLQEMDTLNADAQEAGGRGAVWGCFSRTRPPVTPSVELCHCVVSWSNLTPCMQDLDNPEQMYRKLGAKMVVGMPFKDQATSDTLYMLQIPPSSDKNGRRALKRLQVNACCRKR